jgi:predicted AlkP superfamily phosphohydrolase/phosphomutase
MSPKILLVGIDGGSFRILKPGISSGNLETFKKLVEEGVSSTLTSTIPPVTIPAFSTLMTGKNPGKHGVFDFMSEDNGHTRLTNGTCINGPTLWRILSGAGRKCIVVNVPMTYPPEEINGIIVSGMMTPSGRNFTHPEGLAETLDNLTDGYPVRFDRQVKTTKKAKYIQAIHTMIEKRKKAIFYLLENWEWDVFVVLFRATDIISHGFWSNPREVLRVYEHIDKVIGKLVKRNPEAYVFIFSDHGFKSYSKYFHVNVFLKSLNLLKTRKRNKITPNPFLQQMGLQDIQGGIIYYLLTRLGITRRRLRTLLPYKMRKLLRRVTPSFLLRRIPRINLEVDIEESKAYFACTVSDASQSIAINASNQKEYDSIVRYIKQQLVNLVDPETGDEVVKQVFHKDEIYHGQFIDQAPDIVILLHEGYQASGEINSPHIIEPAAYERGTHEMEGVFIAKGQYIKSGTELNEIGIQDIAPTILHLLAVPIPEDVDGKIRHKIFQAGSPPTKRKPTFYNPEQKQRREHQFTKSEEEEIKERLRNLGYID